MVPDNRSYACVNDSKEPMRDFTCSICRHDYNGIYSAFSGFTPLQFNYCPHCGATIKKGA